MMTPKDKAEQLYNKFDMIIYTAHDAKGQIFACMDLHIEHMIDEHFFDKDETRLNFWKKVKLEKEKLK